MGHPFVLDKRELHLLRHVLGEPEPAALAHDEPVVLSPSDRATAIDALAAWSSRGGALSGAAALLLAKLRNTPMPG